MNTFRKVDEKMTNFRWVICGMLFFATTVNYLDRQVLSLTWKDFIAPEFHWTDSNYGDITAIFSGWVPKKDISGQFSFGQQEPASTHYAAGQLK